MSDPPSRPCEFCPWRITNHGKRTPWGFYTKANLRRLWNQIRRATDGTAQSCHPTDPSHEDHIAAGAKSGSTPKECAGSVILVLREFAKLQKSASGEQIGPEHVDAYLKSTKDGLTRSGLRHWLIARYQFGGVPLIGGTKLPNVDTDEVGIGRP